MNSEKTVSLELPLILPEIEDEKDQCIQRLLERLRQYRWVLNAHVENGKKLPRLCLHYHPGLVPLSEVKRIASQEGAAITERFRHETLRLENLDCEDCALSLEAALARLPGVITVSVNSLSEIMRIEYDTTRTGRRTILKQIEKLGFSVPAEARAANFPFAHRELSLSLLSGLLLAVGFGLETFLDASRPLVVGFYVLAYAAGGYDALRHGIRTALHLQFDIDVLMVTAAVGAAILGHWVEGGLLLFLFSLGHALQHLAADKARNAINRLGELMPKTARLLRDGGEIEIPVGKLVPGQRVLIRPGERIPVDGAVEKGASGVDESPITGESLPVSKEAGAKVFAGSVNGDGALEVMIAKHARDTTLARIIQMVEEAQTQKSRSQRVTERFERVFVPVVLASVALLIVLPPLFGWLPLGVAFLRGMAILVAASPCALALAVPSAILSAVACAARNGVLFKGGIHLENLGGVAAMAFDKTGTLTEGRLVVTDLIPLNGASPQSLLEIAAALESRSTHPIARAITARAEADGIRLPVPGGLQAVPGKGIEASLAGKRVRIGNLKLFTYPGAPAVPPGVLAKVRSLEAAGKTTMLVKEEDLFLGVVGLADQPRAAARSSLARLKALGIEIQVMITGDNETVARYISQAVGIHRVRANLLPEEKVRAVRELIQEHGRVAMVGDGVNDAPAMTSATVGIAMGASGTDVAMETADVALMADDLARLPFAVALSRQCRRIIQQNLMVALVVIAALLTVTSLGLTGITVAVVAHEGSTLVVIANALRLLNFRLQ